MSGHIRVSARALVIENGALLAVEFDDESGLHYNLPGGGVDPGESIGEALQREAMEEAFVEVEVGALLFIVEYEPVRNLCWAGAQSALSFVFECKLREGSMPRMPDQPDPNQTAIRWIPLSELEMVELLPHIGDRIARLGAGTATSPILLQEPIDPDRARRYLGDGVEFPTACVTESKHC